MLFKRKLTNKEGIVVFPFSIGRQYCLLIFNDLTKKCLAIFNLAVFVYLLSK